MKLKIQNGAVEIKGETILEKINFEIKDGDHVAIVGKNGAGKTTLLNAILNNEFLIEGIGEENFQITKIGNLKIGYLEQIKINENLSLFDELVSSFDEIIKLEKKINYLENNLTNDKNILDYSNFLDKYNQLGGYSYKKEIETMIFNFGFKEADKQKKLSEFSGGEKMKITFMKLLLSDNDLLLLDEPTNHLDITTIEWLEEYLKNYKKAFIVVSHDRMFLDNIVNIIYDIEYGETIKYVGNYSKYVQLKNERHEKLLKDYDFQQKEIKRLNTIYEKFRYKPTKAKMALSKLKQIERMVLIDKPRKENTKTFNSNVKNVSKPGKIVLTAKDLEFGYEKILGKVNLEVERGKKIGIIGSNGIGKSTLLKTLYKIIKPITGIVSYGYNVQTAYFDQNLKFETNGTILEEFCHKYSELLNEDARRALGSFLFSGEDVDKKLDVLSGGEKVRLLLCETFFSKSNLMFLDEPTNHLDIIGKEKLEHLLKEYPETIIFVSHDRYFVKSIADELLVFDETGVSHYKYGYDEYIEKKNNVKTEILKNKNIKKIKQDTKKDNNLLKKIEKEINDLYQKLEILNKELYNEDNYNNYQKINELNNQINELNNQLIILEEKWEKLI